MRPRRSTPPYPLSHFRFQGPSFRHGYAPLTRGRTDAAGGTGVRLACPVGHARRWGAFGGEGAGPTDWLGGRGLNKGVKAVLPR